MHQYDTYESLLEANPKIDFIYASCDRDDAGDPKNHAITKNGVKALGLCRVVNAKDRAMDRGDAEIMLDRDWWERAMPAERDALLDHELHHLMPKLDRNGNLLRDDQNRPMLKLRKHCVEVGWFRVVAARHGANSMERIQAKVIMEECGQYFWDLETLERAALDCRESSASDLVKNLAQYRGTGLTEDRAKAADGAITNAVAGFKRLAKKHGAKMSIAVNGGPEVEIT